MAGDVFRQLMNRDDTVCLISWIQGVPRQFRPDPRPGSGGLAGTCTRWLRRNGGRHLGVRHLRDFEDLRAVDRYWRIGWH